MFTGIIEEKGRVAGIERLGGGIRLAVRAERIFDDLKVDDSVAVNGVCQTVVRIAGDAFYVVAVEETLKKTTLGNLAIGSEVNLERALTPTTRLGGHIVQGHTDCVGRISRLERLSTSTQVFVAFPREFGKYCIRHGSITIDGTSLTIAQKVSDSEVMLSIIPHTMGHTLVANYAVNTAVNVEFDVIGKYVENLLGTTGEKPSSSLDRFIDQPMF